MPTVFSKVKQASSASAVNASADNKNGSDVAKTNQVKHNRSEPNAGKIGDNPFETKNRFMALLQEAKDPPKNPSEGYLNNGSNNGTGGQNAQEADNEDEGLWIPDAKTKKKIKKGKENKKGTPKKEMTQIPKRIPNKCANAKYPDNTEWVAIQFPIEIRIATKTNEVVVPHRLLQAVLGAMQHVEPSTAIVAYEDGMEDATPLIDIDQLPKGEEQLSPYVAEWKKLRASLVVCKVMVRSELKLDQMKQDDNLMKYLKEESIILDSITLQSGNPRTIGFIVNMVPQLESLQLQQTRLEMYLEDAPAFQLIRRKLSLRSNPKIWCDVLKIRVDKGDEEAVSTALKFVMASGGDFHYYPFNEYICLQDSQKQGIIEMQREFLKQNRSVVVPWDIAEDAGIKMWMEDPDKINEVSTNQTENDDEKKEDMDVDRSSQKRTLEQAKENSDDSLMDDDFDEMPQEPGDANKKHQEDTANRKMEKNTETNTEMGEKRVKEAEAGKHMFNNIDLTASSVVDFIYSYKSGDGRPIVRYIYPAVDGKRELLVDRQRTVEANTFIDNLFLELVRNMSEYSRSVVFPQPDGMLATAELYAPWQPLTIYDNVPHSASKSTYKNGSNKRKANTPLLPSYKSNNRSTAQSHSSAGANAWNTPFQNKLNNQHQQSVNSTMTSPTVSQGTAQTIASSITESVTGDVSQLKTQVQLLQQQNNKISKEIQVMLKQQQQDTSELNAMILADRECNRHHFRDLHDQQTKLEKKLLDHTNHHIGILHKKTIESEKRILAAQKVSENKVSNDMNAQIEKLTGALEEFKIEQNKFLTKWSEDKEARDKVKDGEYKESTDQINEQLRMLLSHLIPDDTKGGEQSSPNINDSTSAKATKFQKERIVPQPKTNPNTQHPTAQEPASTNAMKSQSNRNPNENNNKGEAVKRT